MRIDYLSYRVAARQALIGFLIQLAAGVGLLVYSRLFQDQAGLTGSFYVLCGSVVWLALAIVFDQHRRERIEALEQEQLDQSGARESSAFESTAADLRVAAKRLAFMHRWLLPGISLALAGALAILGYLRLMDHFAAAKAAAAGGVSIISLSENERGWAIASGIVLAFLGFALARYVAGMAKQAIWANLRAGSAQAAGAALFGLAMVLGHAIDTAGPDTVLRYLNPAFSVAMLFFATEIIVNFVLSIYRPRRPGEFPRPAFDSKVLSFVAAPDRIAESVSEAINYQFGYDVTSSWFYQLLTRRLSALFALGAIVLWLLTGLAVVQPNEQGLRIRNGRLIGESLAPGAYLKLPWPFERIERQRTTAIRVVDLGSPPPGDIRTILWTNDHKVAEKYLVVQPHRVGDQTRSDGQGDTASSDRAAVTDLALVSVEVRMYYTISDARKFVALAPDGMRDAVIRAAGRREVMKYLATRHEDEVLGSGRSEANADLVRLVSAAMANLGPADGKGAGVTILGVEIEGVHPPKDTAASFESVVSSRDTAQANIESAHGKRVETLTKSVGGVDLAESLVRKITELEAAGGGASPQARAEIEDLLIKAGGEAAAIIQKARADRWAAHMGARGRAERYSGQLLSFRASPEIYAASVYFDAWEDILSAARVYITSNSGKIQIRTDLKDTESTDNPLFQAPPPEETTQ